MEVRVDRIKQQNVQYKLYAKRQMTEDGVDCLQLLFVDLSDIVESCEVLYKYL